MLIVRLGHPALRKRSKSVSLRELRTKKFQIFLDKLTSACTTSKGVGIAAPQVNVNKRVIVVHVDPKNPRYPDKQPFPLAIIINPKISAKSDHTEEDWEGDLSCSLHALVPRFSRCTVTGLDRNGTKVTYELNDSFHARVFQHEIDHLDGIFLLDRVKSKDTICEQAEWKKYWKNKNM